MRFFRRRKIFVDKAFQIRFAFFFLMEALTIVLLTLAFQFHLYEKYSEQIQKLSYDNKVYSILINGFVGTELATQPASGSIETRILLEIAVFAAVIFFIVLIPSVMASHRIAGPLFKLDRIIKEIARGNYSQKVSFRKGDAFKNIESSFNEMLSSLDQRKKFDLQDIDNTIQKMLFLLKKNQTKDIQDGGHEIRDILLKIKKRKTYNE
jgi:methyl-accepting chemotaxis protein